MGAYNIVSPGSLVAGQPEDVSIILQNFQAIASVLNGGVDNSNIAAGAGIAYSKLGLTGNIVNADIAAAAAIAASKLAGYPSDGTKALKGDGTWGGVGALYKKTTQKQVIASITAADLLNSEVTIGAGVLGTGGAIRLKAWGSFSNQVGADSNMFRFAVLLGGTTVFDTGAPAFKISSGATRSFWRLEATILNNASASAQIAEFWMHGMINSTNGGAGTGTVAAMTTGNGNIYSGFGNGSNWESLQAFANNTAAINTAVSCPLLLNVTNPNNNAATDCILSGATVELL